MKADHAFGGFHKRIYTPQAFRQDIENLRQNLWRRGKRQAGRLDRAFAERIMLTVTRVNGCRYCAYAHTRLALTAGISREESAAFLNGEWPCLPPGQAPALLFAQHYAETGGRPEPQAWAHLAGEYDLPVAEEILFHIRVISVGNLLGNTFDALLSRFAGRPSRDSSLTNEAAVLLSSLLIPAWLLLAKTHPPTPIGIGSEIL